MSDPGNGGARRDDALLIAELREHRARIATGAPWTLRVTLDELDALLAAVDERDAFKREATAEPTVRWEPSRAPITPAPVQWPRNGRHGPACRALGCTETQ